jgi:dipeptidyl aminopeptidase/acylaminoacyl peptidase
MRDLTEGVNAAVNKVIEMGVADPGRLGVTGQSYGGYSTIAIVTQTTRFKGAIMSSGFGNMIDQALRFRPASGADASYWTEGGQGLMGGTLWEQKERYLTNSPVLYLDRVRTPVLIISGEDDDTVPVVMGDQIFVGLRRLGREVEYRRYAGEGHVISSSENVIDYWRAAIRWFDTYVKNAPTAVSQRTTG